MSESKALWEAVGELRRTRRELVAQLSDVVREASDQECSFCGAEPPDEVLVVGPEANICARCVELCREILELG